MKNVVLLCLAGAWICLSACHHGSRQPMTNLVDSDSLNRPDSNASSFFPVAEVLESEILSVDTVPRAIWKFNTQNGRTDSILIPVPAFNALALEFVAPELRDGSFQRNFTESSFMDRSSQTTTFTYSTTNKDLPLQRVDVIVAPQGETSQMKSIYLERHSVSGDSSILKKLYWRAGLNFQIYSSIRVKGRPAVEQQVKVIWDRDVDNE
jgi:hypothetical protein